MRRGCSTKSAALLFGRHAGFHIRWLFLAVVSIVFFPTGQSMPTEDSALLTHPSDKLKVNEHQEYSYQNSLPRNAASNPTDQSIFSEAVFKNISRSVRNDDILADFMQTRSKRAVVGANAKIWNVYKHNDKYVVPYTIVSNYTVTQIKRIEKAMEEIESRTCILFQHINDIETSEFYKGRSYVEISNSPNDGCHSVIGRSERINAVKLEVRPAEQKTCVVHHIVLHELLHLLGLYHEHQRPDRDNFMTIVREHVEEGRYYNFHKKMDARTLSDLIETNGTNINDHPKKHKFKGFDEQSIMMYKANTFSKKDGLAVIQMNTKKWQNRIGQSKQASELDYLKINLLYNCPGVNKMLAGYNGKKDINKSGNTYQETGKNQKHKSKTKNNNREDDFTENHAGHNKSNSSAINDEDSEEDKSKAKRRKRKRKHHSHRRSSRKHSPDMRRKSKSRKGSKTNQKSHSHRSKSKRKEAAHHKHKPKKNTANNKAEKYTSKKSGRRNRSHQDTELQSDEQEGEIQDSPSVDDSQASTNKSAQTTTVHRPEGWRSKFNKMRTEQIKKKREMFSRKKPNHRISANETHDHIPNKTDIKKSEEKSRAVQDVQEEDKKDNRVKTKHEDIPTEIDKRKTEEKSRTDQDVQEEHKNEAKKDKTVEKKHQDIPTKTDKQKSEEKSRAGQDVQEEDKKEANQDKRVETKHENTPAKIDKRKSEEKSRTGQDVQEQYKKEATKNKTVETKHEHAVENEAVHKHKENKVEDPTDRPAKTQSSEQKQEQQHSNEGKQEENHSAEKEMKKKSKVTKPLGVRLRKKPVRYAKKFQLKNKVGNQQAKQEDRENGETQMQQEQISESMKGSEKDE